MKAVIMAGGQGLRLRPFTYMIPKPLLPVGDITILEHTIRELKRCGFTEIIVSTNYQAKQFEKCLSCAQKYDMVIRLIKENKKLGTAGSLALMREMLVEPFCVINGDLIIHVPLDKMLKFHRLRQADITVGIKLHRVELSYAVVTRDDSDNLIEIREKPTYSCYINSGIYVISPSVFEYVRDEQYLDMPDLVNSVLADGGKVLVYDIGDRWLDTGHIVDYEKAIEVVPLWMGESV